MFILSVRASSIKIFAIIAVTLAILTGVVLSGGAVSAAADGEIDFSGIKTEEQRRAFIRQCGIQTKPGEEKVDFVMPENFDRVMLGYNEIQKLQGLDISKYSRKRVTRYTYEVENYPDYEGRVNATLLVYKGRVIGCDVSSADPSGFVKPLVSVQ